MLPVRPCILVVAVALAGCAGPASEDAPGPLTREPFMQCVLHPCAQEALPANALAEEPDLAVNPADPDHVVVAAMVYGHPDLPDQRWIGTAVTFDAGASWSRAMAPVEAAGDARDTAYSTAADASVAFTPKGDVVLTAIAWRVTDGNRVTQPDVVAWRSGTGGASFEPFVVVHRGLDAVSAPALVVGAHSRLGNDKPWLDVDAVTGRAFVTWSRLTSVDGAGFRAESFVATSDDAGASWSEPRVITDGGYFGPTVEAYDGVVLVGLKRGGGGSGEYALSRSTDGGASFTAPAAFAPLPAGDYEQPAIAFWEPNASTPLALVAVPSGDTSEDVHVYVSGDAGASWEGPMDVPAARNASVERHPVVAVDPLSGRGLLAFYEAVDGDPERLHVIAVPLADGTPAAQGHRLTTDADAAGSRIKDYIGADASAGRAFVAWDDLDEEADALRVLTAGVDWTSA